MRTHLSRTTSAAALALALALSALAAPAARAASAPRAYAAIVDAYFDDYFAAHPSQATDVGFHQYDAKLEDISAAAHESNRARLRKYLAELEAVDAKRLPLSDRDDLEMLESSIRAQLLEEETVRMWRRNPDIYSSLVTGSVFSLMKRDFAPVDERLRSVVAREELAPALLTAARGVLADAPKIYTEVAIQQLPDIAEFFRTSVPEAFATVKDDALRARFEKSNRGVIDALDAYRKFLETELLPRSNGSFALGASTYRKKLLYEEMVDIPLDRLLEIGYAQLRKDQKALDEAARRIDPKRPTAEVLAALEKDHPSAADLIPSAQKTLDGLRQFIRDKGIMTVPGDVQAKVVETPAFARALTFASMDTPGPFEEKATEAYYNITLPDPSWPEAKKVEYLEGYNFPLLSNVSVHEVWPGHYMQFLWLKTNPNLSKVRKLVGSSSNSEGWAHYSEQMMLDEGYQNGDARYRMAQIVDALLRDCRYIVGIRMHTKGMTMEQAVDFFVDEGHQKRVIGEIETKRGTSDATYLYYTLGKLEILKLRDDYRAKTGAKFSLREFHDRFIQAGSPAVKIVRREMLGDDSPVL
jgi:uncharacterized protein (DUF885 family)